MVLRRLAIVLSLCAPAVMLGTARLGATASTANAPATIHVPADAPTIQAGIDAAASGDTVLVAPGTYLENISFEGKAVTVEAQKGPSVTIIDGRKVGTDVTFDRGETPASVLEGFTLRGGDGGPSTSYGGGGIWIEDASPTIRDNVVTANSACTTGGGIGVSFGSPIITGNTITGNVQSTAGWCSDGGPATGIGLQGAGSAQIVGNLIASNVGGGMWLTSAGAPTIEDNVIQGNQEGGLELSGESDALIAQNLIAGNTMASPYAHRAPAAVTIIDPRGDPGPTLLNNTIVGNAHGAVQLTADATQLQVVGNIITAAGAAAVICSPLNDTSHPLFLDNDLFSTGPASLQGCDPTVGVQGNIAADPRFVHPSSKGGDYHLQTGSPAIDAGDSSATGLPATDLGGSPRVQGPAVDLGVYEAPVPAPPGEVVALTLSRGTSSAKLSWSAPPTPVGAPVTAYRITVSGGGTSQTISAKKTSAKVSKLTTGVSYTFTVVAVNTFGTGPPATVSG